MNIPDAVSPLDSFAESAQASGLTTTMHNNGDTVVLEVDGEVDMLTAPLLRDAVTKSLQDRPQVLVLDLLAVRFLGSSGLAILIEAKQLAGEHTRLRIVADGPTTRRPLHITGLDQQFALYSTREDALRIA
jgi:anti-sigma B factor antagonist